MSPAYKLQSEKIAGMLKDLEQPGLTLTRLEKGFLHAARDQFAQWKTLAPASIVTLQRVHAEQLSRA